MTDFIARKGITPNLTSRMSESLRNKWKKKYINLKKGSVIVSFGGIAYIEIRSLIIDLFTSKLKLYGYKAAFFIILGPWVQITGLGLYVVGGVKKLSTVRSMCEIGSKITAGEMNIMNWMWLGTDLILFGEPVPIIESTDFMLLRNESSLIEEVLETIK